MDNAHKTHSGIQATERTLRMVEWWPVMSQELEDQDTISIERTHPSLGQIVSKWPEADVWE